MALASLLNVQHRELLVIERLSNDPWRHVLLLQRDPPHMMLCTSASSWRQL